MPLDSAIRSLKILVKNLNTSKPTTVPFKKERPDKAECFPAGGTINFLERGTPEEFGYTTEYVRSFLNEISCDLSIRANRILVVMGDKVVAERYEHPYVKDSWDCVFSATKTVTALALGALWDEGKIDLDEPVYKILDIENKVANAQNKKITLRHLLTMSTGNAFNEVESAASLKWIKGFFDSINKFRIGSKFEYNSLNTYIIGAVVEKVSAKSLSEFVREKIFDPLGIAETLFEISPEGIAKSGWGLYILPEDLAKLGILLRDFGAYRGKRIISEDWIRQMSSKQISATAVGHRFDYGFQTWVNEDIGFCCYNGMYNQDVLVYRNSGAVVVACCANNEAFHGSNHYTIAEKYFASAGMSDIPLVTEKGGRELKNNDALCHYYDKIANKEYKPLDKNANSCGILPLLIQNEMGTYAKGISALTFKRDQNGYSLCVRENETDIDLRFDFENGVRNVFDFYGNLYDTVCDGRFILSGKGEPLLVIRLFFLEFASSRYFTIKFGKDMNRLSVEASENPGLEFIDALIESQDRSIRGLLDGFMKLTDKDVIETKAKGIFSPTFKILYTETQE